MHNGWIKHGNWTETELCEKIRNYDYKYFIAFHTDRFLSGYVNVETLDRIEWKKLLEIRLFSEKGELLARRTMVGGNHLFQWRIASEEGLADDEYIIRYQTLDIDSDYIEKGEFGNLKLMSTGGGRYELPIDENMKSIKVISYVDYEEDGMAFIYDDRLAGFVDERGEA